MGTESQTDAPKPGSFAPEAVTCTGASSGWTLIFHTFRPTNIPCGPEDSEGQIPPIPVLQQKHCIMAAHFWKLERNPIHPTKAKGCCSTAMESLHLPTPAFTARPSSPLHLMQIASGDEPTPERTDAYGDKYRRCPDPKTIPNRAPTLIFKRTQTKSSLLSGRK